MIPAAELADLRSVVTASYPDSAQVSRITVTSDNQGGQTETPGIVATIPCRVMTETIQAEGEAGGRIVGKTLWQLGIPWGADVRPKDELLVNGETYQVQETTQGESDILGLIARCAKEE